MMKDRTETSIGGAQKDTLREWAGKAANMQPVYAYHKGQLDKNNNGVPDILERSAGPASPAKQS